MADEDFLVQHPDKDENDVELSFLGAVKYVFYLSTNGKLAKWSSNKHPRDKNGRWIRTSSSSYIYGKSERASFSAVPGSSDVQVTLQPGDRVWRMSTGSRIVQHADGSGEFYVNSNPNDKTNLSAAGVDGMLQVKALDAQLEQAVPGHVVKANNEKDAERAFGSPSGGGSTKSTPSAPRAPKAVPSGGSSGSREVSPTEGAPSAKKPRRTQMQGSEKPQKIPDPAPKNDEDKSYVQKATEEAGRRAAAKEALERYKKEQEKRKQQEKASKTTEEFKDQTFTEPKETVVSHSELGDIRVKLEPGAKLYQADNGFIVLYTGGKPPVLFKENGKTANPGLSTHEISQLPLQARISLKGRVQEFNAKDKKKSSNDSKQVNKDPFKTETPKPSGEHSAVTDSSSTVEYVSQEKYDEMMDMFKSLGITEVDGIPVTERYKVRKKK